MNRHGVWARALVVAGLLLLTACASPANRVQAPSSDAGASRVQRGLGPLSTLPEGWRCESKESTQAVFAVRYINGRASVPLDKVELWTTTAFMAGARSLGCTATPLEEALASIPRDAAVSAPERLVLRSEPATAVVAYLPWRPRIQIRVVSAHYVALGQVKAASFSDATAAQAIAALYAFGLDGSLPVPTGVMANKRINSTPAR